MKQTWRIALAWNLELPIQFKLSLEKVGRVLSVVSKYVLRLLYKYYQVSLSVCMYFYMHWTACFQKCNLISAYVMRYEIDMIITCIVGLGDVCFFLDGLVEFITFIFFILTICPLPGLLIPSWSQSCIILKLEKKRTFQFSL